MNTDDPIQDLPQDAGLPIQEEADLRDLVTPEVVWPEATIISRIKLHATFVILAVLIIGLSFLMKSEGQTQVYLPAMNSPLPATCLSKRLTGLDCPGCGMTRAFISISHWELRKAWQFNAASFVFYPFIAFQIPWHLFQIFQLRKYRKGLEVPYFQYGPIAVFAVLLVNWLIRLAMFAPAP